ncbi:MAG: citramalate synthase [Candidatus Woesearchaeota archaeon]
MEIYDTTLRDGAQAEGVNFTTSEKLRIIKILDDYGIDYIEAGWPSSNESDKQTFQESPTLNHATLVAFGATHNKNLAPGNDPNLEGIIDSGVTTACIFGKTWKTHVTNQLGCSFERNLELIHDSVAYLRSKGLEVFFDAEHFFDGFADDPDYALACLRKAHEAGASRLVMCDTNGGMLPSQVLETVEHVAGSFAWQSLGVHMHNDGDMAVANSIIAAPCINQIQGTINGIGERCGNANLSSIIPNLMIKKGITLPIDLEKTVDVSKTIYNYANIKPPSYQPYTGRSAFAHKGGVHVGGMQKEASYEHIDPLTVGNRTRYIHSKQSGSSNIITMAKEAGFDIASGDPRIKEALAELKHMDDIGYEIEGMPSERYLLMHKHFGLPDMMQITGWRAFSEDFTNESSEAVIEGFVNDKPDLVVAKVGKEGPVAAIYDSLQKLVAPHFPEIRDMRLSDYKMRIAEENGQNSPVRVYVEFSNNGDTWGTAGISRNSLKASKIAVEKGFQYYLRKYCQ